ncbi:NmrA family transcriptional regulator [Mycolicibacterium cyprinidarum]|uniref:NmrA family transcriptional regulator n=1 Tax=Mycolicibacterium cyprinidarum TaxID=2860311 RepID=A0ABQ4V8T4_9MYCO|nr:NmrA family transcriptional regulator [Mycolicibacterium sp. NGTWS0302]GJF14394.1 NmrA family transcriptional regulator [Mycolicibacterium sp. NGTWSNA01]
MLLITGPSGNVGAELVDLLAAQPTMLPWRVASRHPDTLRTRLSDNSVEVIGLDFFDRSTWPAALAGVDALFLLFPLPGNRAAREAILPFLQAAQDAGCRHVVYVSVFGADRARFIPHYKVEAALRASSMTFTVLRCSFFMQNLHRHISTHGVDIAEHGELFVPAGRGRTTFIDARDAAAVAASALTQPEVHRNVVHHLTGPAALSMEEVAVALSLQLGYPVTYTRPGLVAFSRRLRRRGVGWDTIGFMSAVYTLTRLGQNQPITDEVARVLGRPPRTLAEFLHDSAWRWRDRAWT